MGHLRAWSQRKDRAAGSPLRLRLFQKAMLWEFIPVQRNTTELVEIKGASKRGKRPKVLTPEQCLQILAALREPYKTMTLTAICTGLRASEILALRWADFDFPNLKLRVSRAVVRGIVDRCKTETSEGELPLDESFAAELLEWKKQCLTVCRWTAVPQSPDWAAIRVELAAESSAASRRQVGHSESGLPHISPHVPQLA
jgi:integrase